MTKIEKIINDKFLYKYFLNNLNQVKLLMRPENKKRVKDILKEICKQEKFLWNVNSSEMQIRYIPKELQLKVEKIHELWEIFIKEAIYCLRQHDEKDPNDFKQDFGIIETKEYFKKFSEFEEVLYGSDKYYRDHSLHVMRVFLLGFYLLNLENSSDYNIDFNRIDIYGSDLLNGKQISLEEKQAIWTFIALSHDLGYPIEKIDKINDKVKGIIKYYGPTGIEEFKYHLPLQNQTLNDFILKFISSKLIEKNNSYLTVIQNKYYLKFAKAFEKFSHGIMSCILLMKHLVYFKESDYSHSHLNILNNRDAKQFLIRRTILRSIASHDNDDIYHFKPNNFLFLLSFCDDLQEWDRPPSSARFERSNEVKIKNFNLNEISFEHLYNYSENFEITDNMLGNFARRVKKYVKLFRSGPDSQKRPFTFIFSLVIKNNLGNDKKIIEFKYPPNESPKILIPIISSENKDYLDLFLKFIEDDYKINQDIEQLVEEINKNINSKLIKKGFIED